MNRKERDNLLKMADADLLRHCRVDVFRGTGRGGQKRNVTDSAVRVTHSETGTAATSDETRSQTANRTRALRALRQKLALVCRADPPAAWRGQWKPSAKNPTYSLWLATVLDVLEKVDCRVSDAATFFGLSTGRFVRDIAGNRSLWSAVNRARQARGLHSLRG